MSLIPAPANPDPKDLFWQTMSSGYDQAKFYIRATNQFDHSYTLQLKITPDQWAVANMLWPLFPSHYRSVRDLFRDRIFHGLHYLNDLAPGHPATGLLGDERLAAAIDARKRDRERWTRLIDDLAAEVEQQIKLNELDIAQDLLDETGDAFDAMPVAHAERMTEVVQGFRRQIEQLRRRYDPRLDAPYDRMGDPR